MPRLLYLSAFFKLRLLYLSELQQLGKAKLFAACESFLAVITFSDRMPKDLESLVCNAAAEAKFYSVPKKIIGYSYVTNMKQQLTVFAL